MSHETRITCRAEGPLQEAIAAHATKHESRLFPNHGLDSPPTIARHCPAKYLSQFKCPVHHTGSPACSLRSERPRRPAAPSTTLSPRTSGLEMSSCGGITRLQVSLGLGPGTVPSRLDSTSFFSVIFLLHRFGRSDTLREDRGGQGPHTELVGQADRLRNPTL